MKPTPLLLSSGLLVLVACSFSEDPPSFTRGPRLETEPCDSAPNIPDDPGSHPEPVADASPIDANHVGDAAWLQIAACPPLRPPTHPSSAASSASPPPVFDCEMHLVVGQVMPVTCAVVDPVSHRVGHLEGGCAGGHARLTLGDLVLEGTMTDHTVSLAGCREDPSSWLSGHYEVFTVDADLQVKKGALTSARGTGVACPKIYACCSAVAGVDLEE